MSKYSRDKGYDYQRTIAKIIGEVFDLDWQEHAASTPQSGGMKWKGDIQKSELLAELFPVHIECKNQKTLRLKEWLVQAKDDCPAEEMPGVVFHMHGTSDNYIVLPLQDFLEFVKYHASDEK